MKKLRNNLKLISLPSKSEELAELIGIILGDGYIREHVVAGKSIATYYIRICGNSEDDMEYYQDYLIPLCCKLFKVKPSVYFHNSRKAVYVHLGGKMFVKFFKSLGLIPGNKIDSQVTIPEWIFNNDNYLRACIRGLIDTDGSIYMAGKWCQICFKNNNLTLLADFRRALIKLGFHASQITWNKVYISRKQHIHNFYKSIGFSNPKHTKRYLRFYSPVV